MPEQHCHDRASRASPRARLQGRAPGRLPTRGYPHIVALALALGLPAPLLAQRPPALKGSPGKLAEQNRVADHYDLTRMDGPAAIRRLVRSGYLVRIPQRGRGYYVDRRLGKGYEGRDVLRYARPWVRTFLQREGAHYAARFRGARFKVSSLVRTEDYQQRLQQRNINAARGEEDDTRSPHLTGSAVDISKRGMSPRQLDWMRAHLVALQELGWIIAAEEMATNSFHVFVKPRFGQRARQPAPRPPRKQVHRTTNGR